MNSSPKQIHDKKQYFMPKYTNYVIIFANNVNITMAWAFK